MTWDNPHVNRVFVIQQPAKLDRNGKWKPIFDIGPARKFGRLVPVLLRPGNVRLDTLSTVLNHMRDVLKDFSDSDYILPTGEPVAIAAVCAIAAQVNGGRLKLLKWDKHAHEYEIATINTRT